MMIPLEVWEKAKVQPPQDTEQFYPEEIRLELKTTRGESLDAVRCMLSCWILIMAGAEVNYTVGDVVVSIPEFEVAVRNLRNLRLNAEGGNTWRYKRLQQFELALKYVREIAASFYRLFTRDYSTSIYNITWPSFADDSE